MDTGKSERVKSYERALDKHINETNFSCNTIYKADEDHLEELMADAFYKGAQWAAGKANPLEEEAGRAMSDLMRLVSCTNCGSENIARGYNKTTVSDNRRWKSVDEALPELEGRYLCCVEYDRPKKKIVRLLYFMQDEWYYRDETKFLHEDETITHWMNLPKPPE